MYWTYIFYLSGFLSNLRLPGKNRVCPEFTVLNIYFLSFRIFEQLALARKKQSVPWIHCIEHIFLSFRIFEQLTLALKNRVALKIFTAFKYFLSFRNFEQLALALKTRVCPEIFQARGAAAPPPMLMLYQTHCTFFHAVIDLDYRITYFLETKLLDIPLPSTLYDYC